MNVRTKSGIVIILTLCIGFALGMLVDRSMMKRELHQRFARMRNPRGLARMLEQIIEPTDAQYDDVKGILDRYSKRFHQLGFQSRQQMMSMMDSLNAELDTVLTDQQKMKLQRRMSRMRQMMDGRFGKDRRGRGRRKPPNGRFVPGPEPPPPPDRQPYH